MSLAIIPSLCKNTKQTNKEKRFTQKRSINIYTENKALAPVEKFSSS